MTPKQARRPVGQNDSNQCAAPYWQAVLEVLAHGGGDN